MSENMPSLLVVDDEATVRKVLRRCFETESYRVLEACDRKSTLDALNTSPVDLITLDVNLDGQDGLSLAKEIRALSDVPIIMVSGKGDLIDTVVGLEVGADDYIAKPFELREVLARVKSALRRSRLNGSETTRTPVPESIESNVVFNNFSLNESSRDLTGPDGARYELTTAEFNLLWTLVSHPQRVMSRDQIMDAVKGTHWHPTDRTIDNQVARLRKKLNALGICQAIKTVRGMGYQFTLDVKHR